MKKILKRLTGLATVAAVFVYMPAAAFADRYNIAAGDGVHVEATVDANGKTIYKVNGAVDNDTLIEIFGNSESQNSSYNNVLIESAAGANALIAFNGLEIRNTYDNAYAVLITGAGNVTIELDGESSLTAGEDRAGIQKENTGTLTIKDDDGDGTLYAEGGLLAAGIGGGAWKDASHIIIKGGAIEAQGGSNAAGIGGGYYGAGSDITVKGGTVTATGGHYGAGIGGGSEENGETITIEDGSVTAIGGICAAGIGGGFEGDGETITISGGDITAVGNYGGAGIGGGGCGYNASVTVTVSGNAVIFAAGGRIDQGESGAAIGTGALHSGRNCSGTEQELDLSELYTTGSVTRFAAGTTLREIKDHPENGTTITGTKPAPVTETQEQVQEQTEKPSTEKPSVKEPTKPSPEKKPVPSVYTERSYMANINVAERIAAALRANPGTKEITLDYADNICLSADMMKDLFADSRVAKNCLFTYKGKRYNMHVGAVNTSSDTYADCFNTLSKEPDSLAGFMKMAEIFKPVGVTLKEITE